jgi:hypothetical protein
VVVREGLVVALEGLVVALEGLVVALEGLVVSSLTVPLDGVSGVAFVAFDGGVAALLLEGVGAAVWFLSRATFVFGLVEAAERGLFTVDVLLVSVDLETLVFVPGEADDRVTVSVDLSLFVLAGTLVPTALL